MANSTTPISVTAQRGDARGSGIALPKLVGRRWRKLADTVREWHRRLRSRRELAAMSTRDLKDFGYPAEACAERDKPFWKA